jgi:thymidylate synthase (FAD)
MTDTEISVSLINCTGDDRLIAAAAKVSTQGELSLLAFHQDNDIEGLLSYLMRNRHGCYDDLTEVMTDSGWKKWPDVDGTELFLTTNLETGEIQYQAPSRVIHKAHEGPMVRIAVAGVDALVTPDHRMLASVRTRQGWSEPQFVPAKEFVKRSYRIKVGGSFQNGLIQDDDVELTGSIEEYSGNVHCVTVPNGTLYVRRNGKPMWCGNSPFEHGQMTFLIKAPIFVMREFQRHRAGWSYNEASGRYREFEPEFWIPAPGRKMKQTGKAGEYRFVELDYDPRKKIRAACETAYQEYLDLLDKGVAREVARSVLPLATITTMYASANPRAIMHFLSLRTIRENAKYPSFPQYEIAQVADQMELLFANKFQITHKLFDMEGRVSP